MKTCLISIFLLTLVSSAAFGSDEKLREWIDSGSWSQGVEYCNQGLFDDLSRRPDPRGISAAELSRAATYCAALASGKGDEFSAGWWWYTAISLDLKTAEGLLPEMRKTGLLQTLPAPRSRIASDAGELKTGDKVQLVSGEIVSGTPLRLVAHPKSAISMARLMKGVVHSDVTVELVVSRNGLPQQPLLVKAQALPVHVLYAYHLLSAWRFEPAKVNGEPVESLYRLTVNSQALR